MKDRKYISVILVFFILIITFIGILLVHFNNYPVLNINGEDEWSIPNNPKLTNGPPLAYLGIFMNATTVYRLFESIHIVIDIFGYDVDYALMQINFSNSSINNYNMTSTFVNEYYYIYKPLHNDPLGLQNVSFLLYNSTNDLQNAHTTYTNFTTISNYMLTTNGSEYYIGDELYAELSINDFDAYHFEWNITIVNSTIESSQQNIFNLENDLVQFTLPITNETFYNFVGHTLYIKLNMTDKSSGIAAAAYFPFKVLNSLDIFPPNITVQLPLNNTYWAEPPLIKVNVFDVNSDKIWYNISGIPINEFLQNDTAEYLNDTIWDNIPQGMFEINFYANDSAGNLNDTFTFTVYKDTYAPNITIYSPFNNTYWAEPPLINVSSFDENLDTIWYTISSNPTIVFLQNDTAEYLNDTLWTNLPNGPFEIHFYANDSAGNIGNQSISLNKHVGMWLLSPFTIDDLGGGDYTWLEASFQGWCKGSGTSNDPYILENIKIDGQNSGSCFEIKNSNEYVLINNSVFTNSGGGMTDAGIGLFTSNNIDLVYNNCSSNNAYGIYLSSCQDILIEGCTINNNAKSGIMLYECDNNTIRNNTDTINANTEYGIYLSASHYNKITGNTINNNSVGTYFYESNYNTITSNDLRYNSEGAVIQVRCTDNNFGGNDPQLVQVGGQFPIEMLILIIIIGTTAFLSITGAVILKKRRSIPKKEKRDAILEEKRESIIRRAERRKEKEKLKVQKQERKTMARGRKIEEDLNNKVSSVDYLIKENNFKTALKNLVEIQKEAQTHDLIDLINEIEEQIIQCKKLEAELVNRIKQTILKLAAKFSRLELVDISEKSNVKDEGLVESVIQDMIKNKEIYGEYFSGSKSLALEVLTLVSADEKVGQYDVFISYSTLDTEYFQVSKIVPHLELYPEIKEVLFWEVDSKQNIVEFMEESLKKANVFVLFCSENSSKSEAVKGEWQSAYQLVKKGIMKIIPVYEDEEHIPLLLLKMLNVRFIKDDFEGFIQKLYEEILR